MTELERAKELNRQLHDLELEWIRHQAEQVWGPFMDPFYSSTFSLLVGDTYEKDSPSSDDDSIASSPNSV